MAAPMLAKGAVLAATNPRKAGKPFKGVLGALFGVTLVAGFTGAALVGQRRPRFCRLRRTGRRLPPALMGRSWRRERRAGAAHEFVWAEAGPTTASDVVAEWMRPRQPMFRRFGSGCK
jgi:hypothetical protein